MYEEVFQTEVALYHVAVHERHSEHMLVSQPCSKGASLARDLFPPSACKTARRFLKGLLLMPESECLLLLKKFGELSIMQVHTLFTHMLHTQASFPTTLTKIDHSN